MTIQVTDSFNQLKIVSGNIVQYYKYATVKSLSPVSDSKGDFAVIINFIVDDKNNPLILKMKDVSNQGTWVNNATGANAAIETISDWMHTDNPSTEVQVTGWTAPLGQKPMATSIPVVISSDQSDIDVILKGPIGIKPVAESVPVTIASDEGAIPVSGSVSATIAGPLGQAAEAASVSVVIASDQTGAIRTPGIERVTNAANVAAGAYSVSFANVHASANSTVKTVILKPGETITFDAGAVNNTLGAIAYVATGSELLIIKIT
tara:strand:- start:11185 stop:11973 length:789 start_codon:yes stop_codon:yes gene_type:complete